MPVVIVLIRQLIAAPLLWALAWVLWKWFQRFVLGSPLDNIPGPPSDSFVTGECSLADFMPRHRSTDNLILLLTCFQECSKGFSVPMLMTIIKNCLNNVRPSFFIFFRLSNISQFSFWTNFKMGLSQNLQVSLGYMFKLFSPFVVRAHLLL
jgi:hypothetical protein